MNNFPKQDLVLEAIFEGFNTSLEEFLFWSNNKLDLSYAPSNYTSINIAKKLAQIEHKPEVFLNASISDILRCSLKNRDSYPKFMEQRDLKEGSICITLDERFEHENQYDSISKVIISVNDNVINSKKEYLNTIETMCKMLYKNKEYKEFSLEYAVFAFYSQLSLDARKKLDKRYPLIIDSFDEIINKYGLKKELKTVKIDDNFWISSYVIS